MSTPSSSLFPPSFRSFPDLEKREDKAKERQRRKGGEPREEHSTKKHGNLDRRRHKRHRDGSKTKDGDKLKEGEPIRNRRDDEQVKREEDRHARLGATYDGAAPGLFVSDKVGDPMNVVYGGIHGGDIPKYRRVGFGNVLGLGNALKIVTRGTGGKSLEIGINGQRPPARYTDPRFLAVLTTSRPRHLITGSLDKKGKGRLDTNIESKAEFIRLPSRRGRSTEEPLSTYRSIYTSTDHNDISDSEVNSSTPEDDIASSSESDTDSNIPCTAHQHSLAALEAVLQKDPTSLSTWYALLDQTLSTIPPSAKSSLAHARAEIKLSVLDRAIRTHRRNKASVELRVKWLNAGAEIWDGDRLEMEWEQAVIELGGHAGDDEDRKGLRNHMWEEWLRWRVSSAGRGSRKTAGVGGIVSDTRRTMDNIEGEMARVRLLWRIAVILREAGFSERAMAIFQAQAELSFNCPPNLVSEPLSTRLDALEDFWDAEHPRMGERNACGWNTWVGEGKPNLLLSISSQQPSLAVDIDTDGDPYSLWASSEARYDASSNMPKHADEADEDPYATVIFSDVRPLLIEIIMPEAKHAFRIAWLEFLGLHVPGFVRSLEEYSTDTAHDDTWSRMHLTRKSYLQQLFPSQSKGKEREWDACAGVIIGREKTYGSTFGCVKEWGLGVFDPLEGIEAGEGRLWEDIDVGEIDKECARRVFGQVRHKTIPHQDEEWDIMAVAFEAAGSIKSALKLSRTLLSASRDALPLWGVHARLEGIRGKKDEARRIYDAVLSASSSASPRRGEAAMWWAWAEMEWLAGEDSLARAVILRAAGLDANATGAIAVLRAKRGLEEQMRPQHRASEWKERESWACLRALLEVVTGGTRAVEEGMEVLKRYISEHTLEGVPRESAWTRMVLLGWKHGTMLGRQMRRIAVRNMVIQAVTELEGVGRGINTAVLGVFLEGEKGESVWGRVKALVGEGVVTRGGEKGLALKSSEKGVARRIWEVWLAGWERGRWEGEKERVRKSLGIGIEEDGTRASPILWRIYVELEIYCGELKRAKALLFRAVSECPLVKELYLLAFGPLRSAFTVRELEGWAETMAERGIRMHHDLDEYAVKGGREESDGDSSSGVEDEFDRETKDYRRLAPF